MTKICVNIANSLVNKFYSLKNIQFYLCILEKLMYVTSFAKSRSGSNIPRAITLWNFIECLCSSLVHFKSYCGIELIYWITASIQMSVHYHHYFWIQSYQTLISLRIVIVVLYYMLHNFYHKKDLKGKIRIDHKRKWPIICGV